jgi:hypothetical protein
MTPEDISRLLDENSIVLAKAKTEANPFQPGDKSGMDHFFCTLSGPSIEHFEFYVSYTPDLQPGDADVIDVLIKDIKTYRGCVGYSDFLNVFGLSDDEDRADVRVAWQELGRLAPFVDQVAELAAHQRHVTTPAPTAPGF